jgi:hypothetical protein
LAALSAFLHNAVSGIFKVEEPVFFILTFLFVLFFALSVIYNSFRYVKKGEPEDIWKLGWLGLFGLLGLVPGFNSGFFGFFGFLGFFGSRIKNKNSCDSSA